MTRLHCPVCGHEVFFDSLACVRCGTGLTVHRGHDRSIDVHDVTGVVPCANRTTWGCNWEVAPPGDGHCPSCELVDAGSHGDDALLIAFQAAQRRALSQLTLLGVPWGRDAPGEALRFEYRSSADGDAAVIGHQRGIITLDLQEADPARREQIRATLGEHYRTPLGHIRHELGHYVWMTLVAPDATLLADFRERFGDERVDYRGALDGHYARADDGAWRGSFVSFYASAHPWEDFAESWAQVMHVHDVVETGAAWGVVRTPPEPRHAAAWLDASITASVAANELARAMGVRDLYPFALTAGARAKIEFCWGLVAPIPR